MSCVNVVVPAVVARVIVVMNHRVEMLVLMFVLMPMLVVMRVRVLVAVDGVSVRMFVRMGVRVCMRMQMLMFMVAVHRCLLSSRAQFEFQVSLTYTLRHHREIVNKLAWLCQTWYTRHTFRSEGRDLCHAFFVRTPLAGRSAHPIEGGSARLRPSGIRGSEGNQRHLVSGYAVDTE
ncbi:MAG: hypothetical protein RDU20_02155 [Desulfomonilaceae bacterium]|nr:hypothetical protein [Desulfomonilaceae bacterium]